MERMDKSQIVVGQAREMEQADRMYWSKADPREKFATITFLRECFYGPEATTGRLQRVYTVLNEFKVRYLLVVYKWLCLPLEHQLWKVSL